MLVQFSTSLQTNSVSHRYTPSIMILMKIITKIYHMGLFAVGGFVCLVGVGFFVFVF